MKDKHLMVMYNIVMLYIIIAQFFALYFWYIYSQSHGFLSTLIIGPIVGEFKGLLFPFFM